MRGASMPIVPPTIHWVLNLAGWLVCLAGVILAIASKRPNTMKVHAGLELAGGLMLIVGSILGMFLAIIHAFIAIVAIVLIVMGIGGGMYYKSFKPASGDATAVEKKKMYRNMHINGGRLTNLMLIIVIVLGFLTMASILVF